MFNVRSLLPRELFHRQIHSQRGYYKQRLNLIVGQIEVAHREFTDQIMSEFYSQQFDLNWLSNDRSVESFRMSFNRVPSKPFEPFIPDPIALPVFVVEVPPLRLVDREALGFHRLAQKRSMPALQ